MSTSTAVSSVPKVRTFAADLTSVRTLRGTTPLPPASVLATSPVSKTTPPPTIPLASTTVRVSTPVKTPRVTGPTLPPIMAVTPSVPKKITPHIITPIGSVNVVPPTEKTTPPFHVFSHSTQKLGTSVPTIDTSEFTATERNVKASILTNPGVEPLSVNSVPTDADNATIITDTKQKRFSLTKAIMTSLGDWWHTKQKEAIERKKPKYLVPEADRRKGVIQKATSQTGRASTADHAAVLTRIKAAKKTPRGGGVLNSSSPDTLLPDLPQLPPDAVSGQITFVRPHVSHDSNAPLPVSREEVLQNWESATETPIPSSFAEKAKEPKVIESSMPTVLPNPFTLVTDMKEVVVPPAPSIPNSIEELPRIEPVIPIIPLPLTPVRAPEPIPAPPFITPIIPVLPEPVAVSPVLPPLAKEIEEARAITRVPITVQPQERAKIIPIIPSIPERPAGVLEPVVAKSETATVLPQTIAIPNWSTSLQSNRPQPVFAPPRDTNRTWSQGMFWHTNRLTFVLLGTGLVLVVAWFGIKTVTETNVPAVQAETTIFSSSITSTPTATAHNKQELAQILTTEGEAGGLTEIILISPETGEALGATELFALFGATVKVDLMEAIHTVSLGSYRSEPWLVFGTKDSTTVQGGMLGWEKQLSADLSPWFGAVVYQSPGAGITLFHDSIIAGHDVRILTDATGTERIVYGFITPQHLLITTNTTAFLNLSEKVISTY